MDTFGRVFRKIMLTAVMLGASFVLPACAQVYDDGYYDGYYGNDSASGYPGVYGVDAYGYCDGYGCPSDYWDMPVYYGQVYYDGAWINGPLYYRDWGGRRQYWIRGNWRYDGWRGARPSWYREGRYGPALGMSWYRNNHVYRRGWQGRSGSYRDWRGRDRQVYRAPLRGAPNRFSTRPENRFQDQGRRWDRSGYQRPGSIQNGGGNRFQGNGNDGGHSWGGQSWGGRSSWRGNAGSGQSWRGGSGGGDRGSRGWSGGGRGSLNGSAGGNSGGHSWGGHR